MTTLIHSTTYTVSPKFDLTDEQIENYKRMFRREPTATKAIITIDGVGYLWESEMSASALLEDAEMDDLPKDIYLMVAETGEVEGVTYSPKVVEDWKSAIPSLTQ